MMMMMKKGDCFSFVKSGFIQIFFSPFDFLLLSLLFDFETKKKYISNDKMLTKSRCNKIEFQIFEYKTKKKTKLKSRLHFRGN